MMRAAAASSGQPVPALQRATCAVPPRYIPGSVKDGATGRSSMVWGYAGVAAGARTLALPCLLSIVSNHAKSERGSSISSPQREADNRCSCEVSFALGVLQRGTL
eukprot:5463735-Pleurochrysis_carterae.AAC.2